MNQPVENAANHFLPIVISKNGVMIWEISGIGHIRNRMADWRKTVCPAG